MTIFNSILPSLITKTPAEGRELAIKVARKTIAAIQPNGEIRQKLRPEYGTNPALLMQAGHIVAIEFQTISAANNYWK
ncbi:MAG: hypothetical protein ACI9LM_002168 [Alteromonadaceae bacterium]|jgi:hypothetical protein